MSPRSRPGPYNGTAQTGVAAGVGYTVSGNVATNAGDYTATVMLVDPANTVWADDTSAPTVTTNRTVNWSIAPAAAAVITVADGGATTNTAYFASLAAAIGAAPTNSTVRLLADVEEPAVPLDTPITLDLNGHFWTVEPAEGETNPGTITISAAVELVNTSESDPSIASSAGPVVSVVAGGSLTVGDNAGIKHTGDQTSGAGVSVAEGGILVVDGGMVGIGVVSSGRVQVSDGNVVGDIAATGANAVVAISGGLVGGGGVVAEGADVAVSGGVIRYRRRRRFGFRRRYGRNLRSPREYNRQRRTGRHPGNARRHRRPLRKESGGIRRHGRLSRGWLRRPGIRRDA